MTGTDIIKNAFYEMDVIAGGETPNQADADFALSKLNRIFDNWNAEGLMLYATSFGDFTLTPAKSPHTIGPSASTPDFAVATARPPKIKQADLVLTNSAPNIYRPLDLVDDHWWMNTSLPTLSTQIPSYLYYNPDWPLGQIYLWPVPSTAYGIRLLLETLLGAITDPDATFTMPSGYEDALTLTLAEDLAGPFKAQLSPLTVAKAREARLRIKSLNSEPPTLACDGAVQSMESRPRASIADFQAGFIR